MHRGLKENYSILKKAEERFVEELVSAREKGECTDSYLVGTIDAPWEEMFFRVLNENEYGNKILQGDVQRIIIGEKI